MKDINSSYEIKKALTPSSTSDNTALTGTIIDLSMYAAVLFALSAGSLADADATFAVTLQVGDASNLSDAANAPAADIIGSLPAPVFSDDDTASQFGYKGLKRYARIVVTPSANASAATFSAVAVCEKKKV